jgi:hypothetical protein
VSFAAITLCIASQQVFIIVSVYFVIDSVRKLLDTSSYSYVRGKNPTNLLLEVHTNGPQADLSLVQLSTTPWRRIGGVEVWPHEFISSARDRGDWSASRPCRFTPGIRDPGTY